MAKLDSYEKNICDGNKPGKLFLKDYGDGVCVNMWIMDYEYDPIRIAFGIDEEITIFPGENKWVMFAPHQLEYIAERAKKAAAMAQKYCDENPEE